MDDPKDSQPLLCSDCFSDIGLKLDAEKFGLPPKQPCPNCGSLEGALLNRERICWVADRFFVQGTVSRADYGGAPRIAFNDLRPNEIEFAGGLQQDVDLICEKAGVGFFYYGPPLWRLGYIEPLEALQDDDRAASIIDRILGEYPVAWLRPGEPFFRLRKDVDLPEERAQFDSPPDPMCGKGRMDAVDLPILYGSSDLQLCVHECRVTVDDNLHVATLEATRPLRLLDLTALLQEDCTTFESLDMTVHLLFLAGPRSYSISRLISAAAQASGFDGLLFPSYFSLLRTGAPFLETAYGLSTRAFPNSASHEALKIVPNIAIFGRPIADGRVDVRCINRLYLRQAAYDLGFGPAEV